MDELGVLLCGNERGAYWYGSQLSIQDARKHVASNSATTLQARRNAHRRAACDRLSSPGSPWLPCKQSTVCAHTPARSPVQVTATVMGGLIWAIENPTRGIVEPEEVQDWRRILVRRDTTSHCP